MRTGEPWQVWYRKRPRQPFSLAGWNPATATSGRQSPGFKLFCRQMKAGSCGQPGTSCRRAISAYLERCAHQTQASKSECDVRELSSNWTHRLRKRDGLTDPRARPDKLWAAMDSAEQAYYVQQAEVLLMEYEVRACVHVYVQCSHVRVVRASGCMYSVPMCVCTVFPCACTLFPCVYVQCSHVRVVRA